MKHAITPIANYGDIVRVVGFGDHLFAVEAYTIEYHYEHDHEYCELLYNLTCVYGDSGYIVGEQDDISVVCKAHESDAFLSGLSTQTPTYKADWLTFTVSEGTIKPTLQKAQPPTDRRKQAMKQTEIDGLLDELSDLLALHEVFGGKDFVMAEKIARVTGKLKEVAG